MRNFSHLAFTLAEMMVVLLIMSIILAAMAPVMTTRDSSMRDNSSPWKWTDDRADTYFGLGDTQTAMIGQKEKKEIDGNYARLIINAVTGHDDEAAHILFKKGEDAITGRLYLSGGNTFLSNGSLKGSVNTAIGYNTLLDNESGQANTAIGAEAMKQNKGNNNTAVGANAYHLGTGENNTVVGVDAFAENSGNNNTAIGVHALRYVSGSNNIGLGYQANMAEKTVDNTIAIGQNAETTASNAISIGINSNSSASRSITLGTDSTASGEYSTAIGNNSLAQGESSIAIGSTGSNTTNANAKDSVAIGREAQVINAGDSSVSIGSLSLVDNSVNSIAIGNTAKIAAASNFTDISDAIAIGTKAEAKTVNSISIGNNAVTGYSSNGQRRTYPSAIAIGTSTQALSKNSINIGSYDDTATSFKGINTGAEAAIVIGYNAGIDGNYINSTGNVGAISPSDYSVAIGPRAYVDESSHSVSLGSYAKINGNRNHITKNNIAIGYNSVINDATSSISIGDSSEVKMPNDIHYTDKKGGIAIGNKAIAEGQHSIAIGTQATTRNFDDNENFVNVERNNAIAIGTNAAARTSNSIAIGVGACKNAGNKANNICIGANSGPQNLLHQSIYSRDDDEHVFIGGPSKFNNGAAVLEVHNSSKTQTVSWENSTLGMSRTAVVVNGNLFVKGRIIADLSTNNPMILYQTWDSRGQYNVKASGYVNNIGENFYYGNGAGLSSNTSDRRLKYVGNENTSGLDKIRQLKVFNYTFKKDEKKTPHVGVIAQDLQKIFPDAVSKAKDGFLRIRFEDMFYAMINAIKELDSRITALEKENAELKKRLEVLEAKIK